jgi:sarcosine oxidase, subunit alpha
MSRRRDARPGEVIDRATKLHFTWNGRTIHAHPGDTIASALLAADVRVVSRSMKYHRPRGYLTADYWDPNGMVQVGDEPNVRSGHRLVADGLIVTAQNVWPSLERDVKALNRVAGRFLSAGFYYKTFTRPRRLWPTYEKILATFAPGGKVDIDAPAGVFDKRYAHPDVVVAGGGPAGMAAAIAAAGAGASVMLVEHEHQLGGHLRWGSDADRAVMNELRAAVDAAGVEVLVDSTVTGRYVDNWVAVVQRKHPVVDERLIKARAKVLVVAPGLIERPYVFAGNDKPGVMTSTATLRLSVMHGVAPGRRAVVLSANANGDAAVEALEAAGVEVAAVVDARRGSGVVEARGPASSVEQVVLTDGAKVDADLLVTAVGWTAPTSLLNMSGDRPQYDEKAARFFPSKLINNVLATGGLAGDAGLDELVEHGSATGRLAAGRAAGISHHLQAATAWARRPDGATPTWPPDERAALGRDPHPALFRSDTHGIVDFSEDVGSKDLIAAAAEGYDSVELAKRFTTATMGPDQGKLGTVNTVAVLAEANGSTIAEVGTTVWRPPYAPITLGALAGQIHEPVRVSSIQPWHEANGAVPLVAGAWIRPEHYGDPAAEVANTRTNVGIIDVTPLGKLDLRGPDAARLLELVYTNRWTQLPVGRVRYGIMCADDGVILDDGVTGRLGDQHYLMTTTSSGASTVWEWIENWLQTNHPDWQVHVTPVTTAFTSINVAGPRARTLLSRLTDIDLEPAAFPYMNVRSGGVGGIDDCFMWRIGFTGELSYELHVPAGHGLAAWEALIDAGRDLGVRPFGVEAQRIMRLEKGHFIVAQDTDGLTKATATGMSNLLRLDKDDFAGKPELKWATEQAGDDDPIIVSIQPDDPHLVPDEATQIVQPGTNRSIGRITSSRLSPTLGRSICLGQVPRRSATDGTKIEIVLVDGVHASATICEHHAHFDPEGARLRA